MSCGSLNDVDLKFTLIMAVAAPAAAAFGLGLLIGWWLL